MDTTILKTIADNPALFKAVKEAVLAEFEIDKLDVNQPDDLLGQVVRSRLVGMRKVEEAFRKIEQCKTQEVLKTKINEAR